MLGTVLGVRAFMAKLAADGFQLRLSGSEENIDRALNPEPDSWP